MQLYGASSLILFYVLWGSLVLFKTGPLNVTVLPSAAVSLLGIDPESERESRSAVSDNPMDYTVVGILQIRILEWVAFPFSGGSFQPRGRTQISCIAGGFFTC